MQVLPEEGTQEGGVQKDEGRSRCRHMRPEWHANRCQLAHGDRRDAAFFASEPRTESGEHHPDAADRPCVFGESSQQTETWFINMIVPAQKTLMVASLDGAEYALLDSGSGWTSFPLNYADDLPLLPRHVNMPILSYATGGGVECIGLRQVGYRLENGEPFVVMWHVANVTNLIISTESFTGANIEVRHAKNENSMIMDRSGTRTSVVLHKSAKVPWLKLRRDDAVLDSDLRIAALSTRPTGIEEIDAEEEKDKHA